MMIDYRNHFYSIITIGGGEMEGSIAVVGECEAMNCLEQSASKAASRDLNAA